MYGCVNKVRVPSELSQSEFCPKLNLQPVVLDNWSLYIQVSFCEKYNCYKLDLQIFSTTETENLSKECQPTCSSHLFRVKELSYRDKIEAVERLLRMIKNVTGAIIFS